MYAALSHEMLLNDCVPFFTISQITGEILEEQGRWSGVTRNIRGAKPRGMANFFWVVSSPRRIIELDDGSWRPVNSTRVNICLCRYYGMPFTAASLRVFKDDHQLDAFLKSYEAEYVVSYTLERSKPLGDFSVHPALIASYCERHNLPVAEESEDAYE